MGWGSLFCYRELARTYSHRTLLPLPLGGIFYSVGAAINLAQWPVFSPGVFGSHELFHLFVIAGSACHILFMSRVVVPAPWPNLCAVAARSQARPGLLLRWTRARLSPPLATLDAPAPPSSMAGAAWWRSTLSTGSPPRGRRSSPEALGFGGVGPGR